MWCFAWFGYWLEICLVLSIKSARGTLNDARAKYNLKKAASPDAITAATNEVNKDLHPHHPRLHKVRTSGASFQVLCAISSSLDFAFTAPGLQYSCLTVKLLFRSMPAALHACCTTCLLHCMPAALCDSMCRPSSSLCSHACSCLQYTAREHCSARLHCAGGGGQG